MAQIFRAADKARVAQLVEQRIRNAKVTSSNPVSGTNFNEAGLTKVGSAFSLGAVPRVSAYLSLIAALRVGAA